MKDLPFIVHFANDILKSFYLCPSQDYQEYYWQQPLLDALICPVSADEDPWIPENRLINYSLIVNHKFTIFSKKNTTVEFLKTHPIAKIKYGQLRTTVLLDTSIPCGIWITNKKFDPTIIFLVKNRCILTTLWSRKSIFLGSNELIFIK